MDAATLVSHLRRTLDLERRARDDALKGEPDADSSSLSAAENDIISQVRHESVRAMDELDRQMERNGKELDGLQSQVRKLRENLEASARQNLRSAPGHEQATKELEQAQAHLNLFMKENKLNRRARIPANRFFIFSMIVGVAVVEGVVNSFFFSLASDFGLLGGFFQAFFVSGVNVGFAFLGGFFALRQMMHVNPARKLAGLAGLALAFVVIAAINLMAAQYRGLLEQGIENPEYLVIEKMISLDFAGALNSINSVLLVLIGLLCAIFALWKGFRADDPYPGYGDMQRDVDQAKDGLLDFAEDSEDMKEAWREDKLGQLVAIHGDLKDVKVSFNRLTAECTAMKRGAGDCSGERLSEVARQLLAEYRDENRKIRGSRPPAYFSDYPAGEEFEAGSARERVEGNGKRLAEMAQALKSSSDEVAELIRSAESKISLMKTSD